MRSNPCVQRTRAIIAGGALLLVAALPISAQPMSRLELLAPWLRGDPAGTERSLSAALRLRRLEDFTLRCAVDFETDRGDYSQARQILTRATQLNGDKELISRREAKLRAAVGDFAGAEKAVLKGRQWDGRDIKKVNVISPAGLNALGEVYAARGMHERALAVFEKSLKESRRQAPHEWTEVKVLVAFSLVAMDDAKTALGEAEVALAFARKQWGDRSPRTLDALDVLGVALTALGRFREADDWLAVAIASRKSLYDRPHPKTAASLLHAARSMAAQGNHGAAIELAEKGVREMQDALPAANARTAFALADAAEIYRTAGNNAEARARLESALRLAALFLGDDAPYVQQLARKLDGYPH